MFYIAEIKQWHHAFSQFKSVAKEDLEILLQPLLKLKWLEIKDKGYILTKIGMESLKEYFDNHYFPQRIKSFAFMYLRQPFWERLQLFVQVFSELSYHNANYVPIIKHPLHQENARLLFQQFHHEKTTLLNNWVDEQFYLLNSIDQKRADILAGHLTGHQKVGKTKTQIQEELSMTSLEYNLFHQDSIEEIIQTIQSNRAKLPIHYAILTGLHQETNYGLSISTQQTYNLIEQGYSIEEIATIRQLKENTVREHILEIAFVFTDFSYQKFVPDKIYEHLNQRFSEETSYNFKQAVSENSAIEFMHYRLVELERIRKK